MLRRLALLAALSTIFALAGFLPATADTQVCTDEADSSQQFCISYGAQVSSQLAATPFDLDVTLANSSPNHLTSKATWVDGVTLHLLGTHVSAPGITPSNQLPDLLVLAGDTGCTSPGFSDCTAGHGTFVVDVSGSGIFDGIHTGTFGIVRIVNVNPPASPAPPGTYDYRLDLEYCIPTPFGQCSIHQSTAIPISGPLPPPGQGSGSVDIPIPLYQSGQQDIPNCCTITYEGTVDSGEIHVQGASDRLQGGASAGGPFTIFRLPPTCGTGSGSATFVTHEQPTPRSVTVNQADVSLTGCPTARFTKTLSSGAHLDGSTSSVAVNGRTIHLWSWRFGDGRHSITLTPDVFHTYPLTVPAPPTYKVRLTVVDSQGAVSLAFLRKIHGTATTVNVAKTSSEIHVTGTVEPARPGHGVQLMLRRQGDDGRFHLVPGGNQFVTLNGTSHYSGTYPRPAPGQCKVVATYNGDSNYLPSQRTSPAFAC
jgi:PKD domain